LEFSEKNRQMTLSIRINQHALCHSRTTYDRIRLNRMSLLFHMQTVWWY